MRDPLAVFAELRSARRVLEAREVDLAALLTIDPVLLPNKSWRYVHDADEGRPGVYVFTDVRRGRPLYVGCSANVVVRIRSHASAIANDRCFSGAAGWIRRAPSLRMLPVSRRLRTLRCFLAFIPARGGWAPIQVALWKREAELIERLAPLTNRGTDNPFIVMKNRHARGLDAFLPAYRKLGEGIYRKSLVRMPAPTEAVHAA